MLGLITLLMIPLILLNLLGGVVSGIWLVLRGEWWAIGYGIAGLLSHFFLSFALLPGLLFGLPAGFLLERGKVLFAFPFVLATQIWTYAVATAWCVLVFSIFMTRVTPGSFWPLLIWSYGVALGPWMYMAQKDQQGGEGSASIIAVFFMQVAYVVMGLVAVFGPPETSLVEFGLVFGAIMLIGMVLQTAVAFAQLRSEQNSEERDEFLTMNE